MLALRVRQFCKAIFVLAAWRKIHAFVDWSRARARGCKQQRCNSRPLVVLQQRNREEDNGEGIPMHYTAEVVGASMGSFWRLHGLNEIEKEASTPAAVAEVPSGISPGYLTPPGSPIYICSNEWTRIWDQVPINRKKDCVVFVQANDGNIGFPPENATVCLAHFRVEGNHILNNAEAPKTILHGRHASGVARILNQHGVATEIVNDFAELQKAAEMTNSVFAQKDNDGSKNAASPRTNNPWKLNLEHIHLEAWGRKRSAGTHDSYNYNVTTTTTQDESTPPQNITIVGGGILGSATALFLAQRLPKATIVVLDRELEAASVGTTTPASWAWINANSKSPKSYQILNQLGIHAWKHETHLSSLPAWMGSLVRFEEEHPEFLRGGGYPVEGPLSASRILELEPFCNWKLNNSNSNNNTTEGFTYYFPDEASVDPSEAVLALKQASKELGVSFRTGHNVTSIVRDAATGKVTGLLSRVSGNEECLTPTDLVVLAAGTGVKALGGIPLLHRPGQIAFAQPSSSNGSSKLSRILVDPMRSSHLLQRKDGTLVAGGGALEVGGSSGTVETSFSSETNSGTNDMNNVLLEGARQLSPSLIDGASLSHTAAAVRPMPTDGLPVVGYSDQGLYVMVTHSGITLAPILASLAAGEIAENVECELLEAYRPSRFATATTATASGG